ncbi:MAG TPA: protease pro-enzyme activation domain-containing protein [Acidobacteriaceae bacterium]|nr:protease pro-enzyme activation domain-containing protein [Acidobacteriaceae bacterium]
MKRLSMYRSLQPLSLLACFCAALALCASIPALAQNTSAKPQPRLTSPIDSSSRVPLAGSRPPRAAAADDLGAVPSTLELHGISLLFSRSPAQQTALDTLVAAQQNPASPLYHQWINPDQYAAQFGVADSDIAAAESWLEQQGFAVDSVSRSRNRILFSGTAAQIASAFGAPLHYYLAPATALQPTEKHFAPAADLTLPSVLASSVLAIGNLSDFRLVPHIVRTATQAAQPRFTSSQSGNHYLTPGDLATIYDITPAYNSGYTGSNQSIAVIGQSAVNLTDITNFQKAVGIAAKTPIVVLVPGSGTSTTDADGNEAESDLDLEYSSTIAKGAQVYFVYTGNSTNFGAFNSIEYAIDQKVAPVVSSSYGACEPNFGQSGYNEVNSYLEQAAAQGQTVVAASGDDGSTDCYGEYKSTQTAENEQLAVDFPASSQYVTGVGGTEFPSADVAAGNNNYFDAQSSTDIISSAKSYIPEMVWNDDVVSTADSCAAGDPASGCTPISSGGGGVSIFTPQPIWQTGTIGGVAIASPGHRMVPDIAMTASPFIAPLAFCTSDKTFWGTGQTSSCTNGLRDSSTGDLTVGGGTSFDAPTFSAMVAIINQAKNSTGQGVVNPTLYAIAATSAYATAFHDITSGGNQCLSGASYCASPGTTDYATTTGYDEASGLGSIDFFKLLNAWPNPTTSSLLSSSTTLTAATTTPASGATDAITITVAPLTTATSVPSGSVSVSVDGGTATSLPLTAGVAIYSFSSTVAGAHTITATYSGDTTFSTSTGSINLTVGSAAPASSFSLAVSAATVTLTPGASTNGIITITPFGGFTGTVSLTASQVLTNGCIVLASSSVAITGTAAGTAAYTIYTSAAPCPSGSAGPGSQTGSQTGSPRTSSRVIAPATAPRPSSPWMQLPLPASLAGAFLLLTLRRSRRLRSKLLSAGLALGLVFALSFSGVALTGCGGSTTATSNVTATTTNTPAGAYTITITGTSGTTTSSRTITLTVN